MAEQGKMLIRIVSMRESSILSDKMGWGEQCFRSSSNRSSPYNVTKVSTNPYNEHTGKREVIGIEVIEGSRRGVSESFIWN